MNVVQSIKKYCMVLHK